MAFVFYIFIGILFWLGATSNPQTYSEEKNNYFGFFLFVFMWPYIIGMMLAENRKDIDDMK